MWLLSTKKQYLTFTDLKGIGHIGTKDPKMNFYQNIKSLEADMSESNVILNSFSISYTRFSDSPIQSRCEDWVSPNVLFQIEDKDKNIGKFLRKIWD